MLNKISTYAQTHRTELAIGGTATALVIASAILLALGAQHLHFATLTSNWGRPVQLISSSTHMPFEMGMFIGGGVAGGLGLFLLVHLIGKKIDKVDEKHQEKIEKLRKVLRLIKIAVVIAGIIMFAIGISYLFHGIGHKVYGFPNSNYTHWSYLGRECWIPGVKQAVGVMAAGSFMMAYALPSLLKDIVSHQQKKNLQLNTNLKE